MATSIYMKATGAKSGQIKGSVATDGRTDLVQLDSVSHGVMIPWSITQGAIQGGGHHQSEVSLSCVTDKSLVPLINASTNSEEFTTVEFTFYNRDVTGAEEIFLTTTIERAHISSINWGMSAGSPSDSFGISFHFGKISFLWADGSLEAEDDILTPNS
ncbi:type VI secretion system tube protein TssD [Rubrivirga sp.]|uniref:type VI secretion system tube protein TssD n=1 Tax=Rubrivirga sp. TaxID=1885344 RepID=UPI003C76CB09